MSTEREAEFMPRTEPFKEAKRTPIVRAQKTKEGVCLGFEELR